MSKPSKPWYRAFNDTWYVQVNHKQVSLAKGKANRKAAYRAFYKLMAADGRQGGPILADHPATQTLFDLFLDFSQRQNDPGTYNWYKNFLQSFTNAYGFVPYSELKPFHVTKWLSEHPSWGAGTQHGAIGAVKRALNWCVDQGLIPANPLKLVKKPAMPRRERLLTAEERLAIVNAYPFKDPFRLFLQAMEQTGARPGEIARVRSEHVNIDHGIWVFRKHKTSGKTGKPRIIYLTPTMVELTRRLIVNCPDGGPLFRNGRGKPWGPNAIRCRFRRIRKKLKLGNGVVAYVYRHGFTTEALEKGVPIAAVAELLGHASTAMIAKHYGHLGERTEFLRQAAIQATSSASALDPASAGAGRTRRTQSGPAA